MAQNPQQAQQELENIETFLQDLQDYTSPIPEAVIKHLMAEGGCNTTDSRVAMVMNVATQKFITEIMQAAAQVAKDRINKETFDSSNKKKMDLQVSDLKQVFKRTRVQIPINRPEYLVSLPTDEQE